MPAFAIYHSRFTIHARPEQLRSPALSAGRTPRQMKNDSAACSTSMPSPSETAARPAAAQTAGTASLCRTSCRRPARPARKPHPAACGISSLSPADVALMTRSNCAPASCGVRLRRNPPGRTVQNFRKCATRPAALSSVRLATTSLSGCSLEQRLHHAVRGAAGAHQQYAFALSRATEIVARCRAPVRRRRYCGRPSVRRSNSMVFTAFGIQRDPRD